MPNERDAWAWDDRRDDKAHPKPQVVRVTREYFLPDVDLRKALGIKPGTLILRVDRQTSTYKGRGRGNEPIDLQGCLVVVYDPDEETKPSVSRGC